METFFCCQVCSNLVTVESFDVSSCNHDRTLVDSIASSFLGSEGTDFVRNLSFRISIAVFLGWNTS